MYKCHSDSPVLPADIVLSPSWWNKHAGISFDEDFFFHPARRVEAEQKMEKVLYEKWGQYGLGSKTPHPEPVVGAVHLASGFLVQEMAGCRVDYTENAPPQVIAANRSELICDPSEAFESTAFKRFDASLDSLKKRYGYLTGDVNWGGVLNIALDLRGESLFLDMFDQAEKVAAFFSNIQNLLEKFTTHISRQTGTTSISVNRTVRHLKQPVFLHSECTHTMISADDYRRFLLPIDVAWSRGFRPFGIHHCGPDAHRFADCYADIPQLDFLDVGWASDVKKLRQRLPNTFLNIRLNPVEIVDQSADQIRDTIVKLVKDSGNPLLTGVCCVNMDDNVSDDQVTAILKTAADVLPERFDRIKKKLENTGHTPDYYAGSADEWKKLCQRKDLDMILITTPTYMHADMAVYAMQQGKHVITEVPAAVTVKQCWELVKTSERTKKHCMMMENYSYMPFHITTLNMAKQGFFGEIVHGDGAYNTSKMRNNFSKTTYWNMWWLRMYGSRKGNIYPTHGLGPIAQMMNINRGDQFDFLVSVESKDFMMGNKAKELAKKDGFFEEFAKMEYRGNMSSMLIKTKGGRTINQTWTLILKTAEEPQKYSDSQARRKYCRTHRCRI